MSATEKSLQKYKNLRTGKKSLVTRKINEIRSLIADRGSRTMVTSLLDILITAQGKAHEDNEQVMLLTNHAMEDVEWMNDIDLAVDRIRAEIHEYLESRADDDPSSAASRTRAWVEQTMGLDCETTESVEDSDPSPLSSTLVNPVSSGAAVESAPPITSSTPDRPLYEFSSIPRDPPFPAAFNTWRDPYAVRFEPSFSGAAPRFALDHLGQPHIHGTRLLDPNILRPQGPGGPVNPQNAGASSDPDPRTGIKVEPRTANSPNPADDQLSVQGSLQLSSPALSQRAGSQSNLPVPLINGLPSRGLEALSITSRRPVTGHNSGVLGAFPPGTVNQAGTSSRLPRYGVFNSGGNNGTNQVLSAGPALQQFGFSSGSQIYPHAGAANPLYVPARNGLGAPFVDGALQQFGFNPGGHINPHAGTMHPLPAPAPSVASVPLATGPHSSHHSGGGSQLGSPSVIQSVTNVSHSVAGSHHGSTVNLGAVATHPVANPPAGHNQYGLATYPGAVDNEVDSWIDKLHPNIPTRPAHPPVLGGISSEVAMACLVQQKLPQAELPFFDGAALKWVEFIIKFKDVVHDQGYLTDTQRCLYLTQHLKGVAKRAVQGFNNDRRGYVLSLQHLKFRFGQRSKIAQATLQLVTRGKPVENDDVAALEEFYYQMSDCLVTLRMLNYVSDLYSSDILRQAVSRLPPRFISKWCEFCSRIRYGGQEPNLIHLAEWLQQRILAMNDASLPERSKPKKGYNAKINNTVITTSPSCQICEEKHPFYKCSQYMELSPGSRFEFMKKLKVCTNCCSEGHSFTNCPSTRTCFTSGCKEKHHTTLHTYFLERKQKKKLRREKKKPDSFDAHDKPAPAAKKDEVADEKEPGGGDQDGSPAKEVKTSHLCFEKDTYLWIVPVLLSNPQDGVQVSTYALLDNASTDTLLREDVSAELGLQSTKVENVNVGTVLEGKKRSLDAKSVSLSVSARDGTNSTPIDGALVVPSSCFNMPAQPHPPDPTQSDLFSRLNGIQLSEVRPDEIGILIGADARDVHIPIDSKRGSDDEPLAVQTLFGWTLFGKGVPKTRSSSRGASFHHLNVCRVQKSDERTDAALIPRFWERRDRPRPIHANHTTISEDNRLDAQLERFWVQEHSGIFPSREPAMSLEDSAALVKLEKETKFSSSKGRYVVPMLRRLNVLPDNCLVALKRFRFLLKRLRRDADLYGRYKAIFDGYIAAGYARKLSPSEAQVRTPQTWYLPHHPVEHPNKPGKTRVVFDGGAEQDGVSLNSTLITGPDLLNSLFGVLLRFRSGRVAISADVEAYYHQVLVPPSDADSLRFLWTDNIESDEVHTLQMLVHVFGAKDSANCVIYALQRNARDNHKDFDALTFETILKSFYMDDCLKSVNDVGTMIELASELIEMCKRGGFRLTKFLSSNQSVLDSLPPSEVSSNTVVNLDGEQVKRALGVHWDTANDTVTFSSNLKEAPSTKRGILRTASSLFDPLGLLTPYTLVSKLLMQDLWRLGCNWDEEIAEPLLSRWKKWLANSDHVSQIKLDRCYNTSEEPVQEVQLHVFCDASELAYGAAAYVRFTYKSGRHHSILVASKSRLAPVKTITLPRLELSSAVLAVRLYLATIIELDLPITLTRFWTDSVLVLQYISNRVHRPKVYVANRQTEILEASTVDQWGHVPGKVNPADALTRGVSDPVDLLASTKEGTLWFNGPSFLESDDEMWPKMTIPGLNENDPELKKKNLMVALGVIVKQVIDPKRYSTWTRLLRTIAWLLRYLANCKAKVQGSTNLNLEPSLSYAELHTAEVWIIKDTQMSAFQDDIQTLQAKQEISRSSKLVPLSPFICDAGILCVGGRLKNAGLPSNTAHPSILPKKNPVTTLIIRHDHVKKGHIGPEHVLSNLREKYWVLHGRSAVKAVIKRCFFCQVRKAQRMYPMMADLPEGRVAHEDPPFTHTGVDLFGPITVKLGRKEFKRYGVLFTCLTVRCVYLDVVEKADTDAFIDCLRKFTNRRGCPSVMYSDRGTNFVGTANELKEFISSLDHHKILDYASSVSIHWEFNPPGAPHMGGAWERLVRSTKEVLSGVANTKTLTDFQLSTLLTEVEGILNSRPLTHVSDNPEDLQALTPNHILFGKYKLWSYIDCDITDKDISSRRHYRQVQALAAVFWRRWRKEYLPDLSRRPIWRRQMSNVKPGELVLLNDDDNTKRGSWPLGRIVRTMPSKDGTVRVAEIKTKSGTYTRPVAKLHRLEDNSDR